MCIFLERRNAQFDRAAYFECACVCRWSIFVGVVSPLLMQTRNNAQKTRWCTGYQSPRLVMCSHSPDSNFGNGAVKSSAPRKRGGLAIACSYLESRYETRAEKHLVLWDLAQRPEVFTDDRRKQRTRAIAYR
jgi:hypothetical protein